jgi:CheY-like chemotaxis protein
MPKKILVIDDDPKMLVLEQTILVQGGFAVETASDGVEGLEKLQTGRYDGIVLDVMMPRWTVTKPPSKSTSWKSIRERRSSWSPRVLNEAP